MEPFRFHLFVCTQQKPEGIPSCAASGSFAVLDALDREIQARGLDNDVQLTTCGCMGLCDEGPVMVVYPAGVWYRRVHASDVSEIVGAHLRDGKPVDRLVWNDAAAMKAMSVEHREKFRGAMAARDKAGMLPDHLDQMIRGFMPSRCILTALELDIFTAVGDGANAEQIGTRIHANARAAGMLLNALVSLGLLSKSGDDYKNTPESARFFVQGSKDNHRNGLLHTANIWHRWSTMTDAVRSGTRVPIDRVARSRRPRPRMDPQLHHRHAAPRQRSRSVCGEGPGHRRSPPHPRSRRRLRRILHRLRQSQSRGAVRDPRSPRGRAPHLRICSPGRRLGASHACAPETCCTTISAPATTSSC